MSKLSDAATGDVAVISGVEGDARFVGRVTSIGLTVGCEVQVLQNVRKRPVLVYGRDSVIAGRCRRLRPHRRAGALVSAREAVLEELDAAVSRAIGRSGGLRGAHLLRRLARSAQLGQINPVQRADRFTAARGELARARRWRRRRAVFRAAASITRCAIFPAPTASRRIRRRKWSRATTSPRAGPTSYACSRTPRSWNEACTCSPTSRASIAPACSC